MNLTNLERVEAAHGPIEKMTTEELYQLKKDRYQIATDDGIIGSLWMIAEELGEQNAAGNKSSWKLDGISIFADAVGNYLSVVYKDKPVCSTGSSEKFIIPGKWLEALNPFEELALQHKKDREMQKEYQRRQDILKYVELVV